MERSGKIYCGFEKSGPSRESHKLNRLKRTSQVRILYPHQTRVSHSWSIAPAFQAGMTVGSNPTTRSK